MRKALHWLELGNEILDSNICLFYGKTKYAAQISKFSTGTRHCPSGLANDNITYTKIYERTAQIFGFSEVLPLTAKDVFVWKRFYKTNTGNERNITKECLFNIQFSKFNM